MADEAGMEWEGGWEGGAPQGYGGLAPDTQIYCPPPDINPRGYSKYPVERFVEAAFNGDLELLAKMLDREDPINGYHNDLDGQATDMNALQGAAVNGQLEAVEMLLNAKADPHVKSRMPYGRDPKDGETAREMAEKFGWEDIVDVLKKAEQKTPKGVYMKYGPTNNAKLYPIDRPAGLDPEQEKRAQQKHKKLVRPLPNRADRKFYGDLVFGVNFGHDADGKLIKASSLEQNMALEAEVIEERGNNRVGFLFPGPGSHVVNMLDSPDVPAEALEILATAQRVLGYDVVEACRSEAKLDQLAVAQPTLYVASLVAHARLKKQLPEKAASVRAIAGLDAGEYAALTAAGVFPIELGLELVKFRAEVLVATAGETPQAALSVAGLDRDVLDELCAKVQAEIKGTCQVSQDLFPKGFACAGTQNCIEALKAAADNAGALQAKLINRTVACSTSFMLPAQAQMEQKLRDSLNKMSPPTVDIFMNTTGAVVVAGTDPRDIIPLLAAEMTTTVKWHSCVKGMIGIGVSEFFEVGPMKQLKAMMKRIDQSCWGNMLNQEP